MYKKLCLMHANCQGEELALLLRASAAFSALYRLVLRLNYTREPINAEDLSACSVFLYQHLGPQWGNLSSQSLLDRLPPSCRSVRIPNMFFRAYWPFWRSDGPIDFSDRLLDRLIDEGAPKDVILRLYLHGGPASFAALPDLLEQTLRAEADKDPENIFGVADFIKENWKTRQIFHTVNHPGRDLLIRAAQTILQLLGLPPLPEAELQAVVKDGLFPSYADFDLPIHPQTAAFYGLDFAAPNATFNIFGRTMSFEAYVSRYIDCRRNGLADNFIGYLQVV
jgi:hypothetical protein